MAHATLHFTVGMAAGTVIAAPYLISSVWRGRALAGPFRFWLLASYAGGIYAVVPALLRRLGMSEAICSGWSMNIFLFHPWITQVKPGGETMGPLLLGAMLAFQYWTLILALAWRKRKAAPPPDL